MMAGISAKNESELSELENLLRGDLGGRGGRFLTVAHIAHLMGCSKPTVYGRIRALQKRGVPIQIERVRDGVSGPLAAAFAIPNKKNGKKLRRS